MNQPVWNQLGTVLNKTDVFKKIIQLKPVLIRWQKIICFHTCLLFMLALAGAKASAVTVWLDDLDVSLTTKAGVSRTKISPWTATA